MKKIKTLKELQEVNQILLRTLYKVSYENNLKLYLIGGTLLGAVRHQGFIPWDDDIDVSMSRDDYNKLKVILKESPLIDYELLDPEERKDFKGYIPQFIYKNSLMISKQYRSEERLHIGISIFIFDGAPMLSIQRWIYYKKMYLLRAFHALCRANFNNVNTKAAKFFGPLLQPLFREETVYKYKKKILEYQKKYKYSTSEYISPNADADAIKEIVLKSRYESVEKIYFDKIECLVPSNYKEHLTNYYGDYMKLPPENKRIPKHSFSVWVNEKIFLKDGKDRVKEND